MEKFYPEFLFFYSFILVLKIFFLKISGYHKIFYHSSQIIIRLSLSIKPLVLGYPAIAGYFITRFRLYPYPAIAGYFITRFRLYGYSGLFYHSFQAIQLQRAILPFVLGYPATAGYFTTRFRLSHYHGLFYHSPQVIWLLRGILPHVLGISAYIYISYQAIGVSKYKNLLKQIYSSTFN